MNQVNTSKREQIKQAQELGKKAFQNKINAPVHDKNLMNMIPKNSPIGTSTHLFKAWQKGWTLENLK